MTNWLERAQREIQESLDEGTAKTAKTGVSAVTAVPHPGESGISGEGFVSFGSAPAAGSREIEVHPDPPPLALAALTHPDDIALWWRVRIAEPGARTVEVDTPSGFALADWQAYADRYHGPGCAVTAVLPLPKPRAPVNLDEALRAACEGVAGISPAQFRALLSPEDIADIEAGDIHPKTLHGYAEVFAEGMRSGRLVPAVASP